MESNRIAYKQEIDHRFIKPVRMARNKTQAQLAELMGVDTSTVGKLERQELKFSPLYESKFNEALKRMRVSSIELASIREIITMKQKRGYR